MVEYIPPPQDLSQLNPIQRYMQKGSLDKMDYVYLIIIVVTYFAMRPSIEKGAQWLLATKEYREGQQAQKELLQQQAKAKIGANAIRGGNKDNQKALRIEENETKASGVESESTGQALNRKNKGRDLTKSEADQLLDWDDEPPREKQEGDKSDVMAWLDKWDK